MICENRMRSYLIDVCITLPCKLKVCTQSVFFLKSMPKGFWEAASLVSSESVDLPV